MLAWGSAVDLHRNNCSIIDHHSEFHNRRAIDASFPGCRHRSQRERGKIRKYLAKRLEDGEFHWPRMQDGVMHLTSAQFSALFEGLDWNACMRRAKRARLFRPDSSRDELNQPHQTSRFAGLNMLFFAHDDQSGRASG